ncbi:hypothetical protein D3C84_782000 [compost metagenome]
MLKAEVLQQTDGDLELLRQQRVFERPLPVLLGAKPLACAPMPGPPRRTALVPHGPGQRHKHPQPFGGVLPRFDKTTHVLQGMQPLRTFAGTEKMLTEAGIESRKMRQYLPRFNQFRRQRAEQFVVQIVEQCRRAFLFVLLGGPLAAAKQGNTYTGTPAATALDNSAGGMGGEYRLDMAQKMLDFTLGERQRTRLALVQLIVEHQPGPVALWTSARGQPPIQPGASDRQ